MKDQDSILIKKGESYNLEVIEGRVLAISQVKPEKRVRQISITHH